METKEVIFFHTDIHRSVKCAFIVQNFFQMALSAAPHFVITVTVFCNP